MAATQDAEGAAQPGDAGALTARIAQQLGATFACNYLVSAGMLGLTQAARAYDPSRGIAFDRFASTRIRGALLDELRGRDWASRSVRARARKMQMVTHDLTTRLGRTPTSPEIAQAMGMDAAAARKLADDVHLATVLNYESLAAEGTAELVLVDEGESPEEAMVNRTSSALSRGTATPTILRFVLICEGDPCAYVPCASASAHPGG